MAESEEALLQNFMQEMEKVQENWGKAQEDMQEEMEKLRFTGLAANGYVEIVLNGRFRVIDKIKMNPKWLQRFSTENPEIISQAIQAAFNDAAEKAEKYFQDQFSKAMEQFDENGLGGKGQGTGGESAAQSQIQQPQIRPRLSTSVQEMKA